jgi:hypothetical protein
MSIDIGDLNLSVVCVNLLFIRSNIQPTVAHLRENTTYTVRNNLSPHNLIILTIYFTYLHFIARANSADPDQIAWLSRLIRIY